MSQFDRSGTLAIHVSSSKYWKATMARQALPVSRTRAASLSFRLGVFSYDRMDRLGVSQPSRGPENVTFQLVMGFSKHVLQSLDRPTADCSKQGDATLQRHH